MSASVKNKAARKIQKTIRKKIRDKPVIYFFDNDSDNFKNCPNNIIMV